MSGVRDLSRTGEPSSAVSAPEVAGISPAPTEEEAVAIVAALELAWPRPVMLAPVTRAQPAAAWRWSGRWWADRQGPSDRRRP